MKRFSIDINGPFSLDTLRSFQCGLFTASRACSADGDVKLAFPLDSTFAVAGASVRHTGDRLEGRAFGTDDVDAVTRQVARITCLDVDARPFAAMLARDPVLAAIGAAHPGFRPVVFHSTWAAAGWAVLTQRMPMKRAAQIARAIAVEAGDVVDVDGEMVASFPRPHTVLARSGFRGVSEEKWARLSGLARAALDGALNLEKLRATPIDVARERLMKMRGVGAWTADSILVRGVGPTDELPLSERMIAEVVKVAWGLPKVPSDDEVRALAEQWRPFRTWTSILVMMHGMPALRARRAA